jgi:hypothetical protein
LQVQVHNFTERLRAGADEYKLLYRKYITLERLLVKSTHPTTLSDETGLNEEALVSLLRNSYELQQQDHQQQQLNEHKEEIRHNETSVTQTQMGNSDEIRECPMCYWEFPSYLTLEHKREHIEAHFD